MEKETKGFKRRDFMKLGIAAGLVAGIPTGIIPKMSTRKAFAKVGSNTRGIFPPTIDELQSIAEQYHLNISREDLKVYQSVIEGGNRILPTGWGTPRTKTSRKVCPQKGL